jgi:hypothetical protein
MQNPIWPRLGAVILASVLACGALGPQPTALEPKATTVRAMYGLKPPSALLAQKTALVLVDFQDELVHGRLALPAVNAALLQRAALDAASDRVADVLLAPDIMALPVGH